MSALGEIFAPIIPALVCGGLILGFRNIIGEIALFDGKTLAQTSPFWQGMYQFLWLIGEAVFHMLPIGIVWSITRKMGTTPILGIVLGATLVSPQLLNAFAVAGTEANKIPHWDFGFTRVNMIGYQGQVISAILAGFVLVYLERFFRRISPAVISMIVVPFCSLVPAVIIAHTLVGPIGWKVGTFIADVVYGGLTSSWSVLFAAVFGFLYAPVVMTGLHHMTNAIDMTLTAKFGGTILWPMIALSNIAQGSSVLAMSVLQRHNPRAAQVNVPACISAYLRHDWLCRCRRDFCRRGDAGAKHWRRRHSRHFVYQSEILGRVCACHGGSDCRAVCPHLAGWAEEIERSGERQRTCGSGYRAACRFTGG